LSNADKEAVGLILALELASLTAVPLLLHGHMSFQNILQSHDKVM